MTGRHHRLGDVGPSHRAACATHDVVPLDRHAERREPLDDLAIAGATDREHARERVGERLRQHTGQVSQHVHRHAVAARGQLDAGQHADADAFAGADGGGQARERVVVGQPEHADAA